MTRWPIVSGVVLLAACSAGSPATPVKAGIGSRLPTSAKAAQGADASAAALTIFERMVAMARRYHLFAPRTEKNLGKSWETDLPRLRAEFAAVTDDAALSVALFHFGNSLHDVHCLFRPKNRGERIKLGIRIDVEKVGDEHRFYVDRVRDESLRAQLRPGDVIVAVDGVPAASLLAEYDLLSNMNSRDNIALDIANALTARRTGLASLRAGMTTTFTVRSRNGGDERSIALTWKKAPNDDPSDFALDYEASDCVQSDSKDYGGGYAMTARGYRVCIYTSKEPPYRDYPIVRHVSFRYDEISHGPLADFELVRRTLSAAKPKAILLDLQDNGGGINPNLFLEWWTDKPYTDTETRMLLDESLLRDEHGDVHISSVNDAVEAWYTAELKSHSTRERAISNARPFMCKPDTCTWDNRYVPRHRVTKAPVALLLGPGCASSCDAFAWHFDKEGIGPIVGRAPMAGFTTHRARFEVSGLDGNTVVGTIDFAISYDTAPHDSESIEGVPVMLDVPIPRTFDNRKQYDHALVDGAIQALATWKP